jgi:hypothetical protein
MIQPTWESGEVLQPEASGPRRRPLVLGSPASLAADVLVCPRRCLAVLGVPVLQAFLALTAGALTAAGPGKLPSSPNS